MAKCSLCGSECGGSTCPTCLGVGGGPSGRLAPESLANVLAGWKASAADTLPDGEADTAELLAAPTPRAVSSRPSTPPSPQPLPTPSSEASTQQDDVLGVSDVDEGPVFVTPGTDVPVLMEALCLDDEVPADVMSDVTTADIDPATLEPILARGRESRPSLPPAAPALPPAPPLAEFPPPDSQIPEHKQVERWNAILDESPVFAGQGHFQVQRPATPEPGALDVEMGVKFEVASAPGDAEPVVHMLVTATPFGAPLMAGREGPVAHLILALDLSASMDRPEKYPVLGRALAGMFRELRSKWAHEVLVSVVAYAYGAETLIRAVPSSQLDEREVLRRLDTWDKRFTRYTDVVGALHRAGRIARDCVAEHRAMPVRIYLLTDGRPQDMAGAREVMELIAKLPVDVHGLAFGDDADVGALNELISGARGGTVKHIRIDTINEAFGRIGEVAQQVVANRALLDVELRPGVAGGEAFRYRPGRHRFPTGAFVKGADFSTDLGTLEAGRSYSLVFQLRLRRTKLRETEIGRITLRVPGWGGPRLFERIVSLPRHPGAELGERDPEVQAALDVVSALAGNDAEATLKALRARRVLYKQERRDAHVVFVIDKAILELEKHGNLLALTAAERATLRSHTLTTRGEGRGPADAAVAAAGSGAAGTSQA